MSSNLESEIKSYNNLFKQHDMALYKLNQFFKTISYNGIKLAEKSKKSLEDFFTELKNENSSATHIICLTNFYNGLKIYFDKMKLIFQNIDTQCAEKVTEFSTNFKNKNNESINYIYKLNAKLKEETSNLEKVKFDYFNANKVADKDYMKTQKETKNKEEMKKNKDNYARSIKILDNMKEKYFLKINNFNKNLSILEKNYSIVINKIHIEQEKKISFYYEILNTFKTQINNISDANKEVSNIIDKINKSQNVERDVGLFKDDYNFFDENKQRFAFEIFLDYEVFRRNSMEKKKNKEKDKKNVPMWGANKKEKDETEEKINDLVKKIFNGNEKINDGDITFLMNYVEKNKENKDTFIEILKYNHSNKQFLKINNIHNFNVLANLIQLIIDSYSNDIDSNLDKFYFMIKISENTLFCDTDFISIKNYLCQKTCSLNLLKQKKFWVKLINTKIKEVAEEKTKADLEKKEKGNNIRGNFNEKASSGLSNYLNIFTSGNKKVENEIIYGQKYKDNLPLCCIEVVEEYIHHFSNFNVPKERAIEIIKEIYNIYKFQKSYLEYFICEIKSNTFSNKKVVINDIFEETEKKYNYNKYSFIHNETKQVKNAPKITALICSLKYLDSQDYYNILLLNKEFYHSTKNVINKIILLKNPEMTLEKKLIIWKKILNYSENKEKYNYGEIKDKAIEKSITKKGRDVIDLDVVRTSFENDKELNQKKLSNLLKSVVQATHELIYNQGMNYVGAFLLNLTKDEEEAFYLFLGLLTSTKYGDLFKNDLAQLKKFFYIFERIISIFIPELYNFLIKNNIKVSYFISSWFITLFTNAYQYIKIKDDPKIILKIFDFFFLNNWKSIIVTSISLLKVYEPKIMLFTSEEILRFLINDVIKENYFENKNYDRFMYISCNFKIDDKLIENIEKELDVKTKLPNLEKNLGYQMM